MLDKADAPLIHESYPLAVAYTALLDAVKSVTIAVEDLPLPSTNTHCETVTPGMCVVCLLCAYVCVSVCMCLLLHVCVYGYVFAVSFHTCLFVHITVHLSYITDCIYTFNLYTVFIMQMK